MTVDIDLREFLLMYTETMPIMTVFKCTLSGHAGPELVRLNMRPSHNLAFSQKAYRVMEKGDGSLDILIRADMHVTT
jgi:hypothetical protein